jgi:flagellum-specific peptidoglycan hydrolase FlgJ
MKKFLLIATLLVSSLAVSAQNTSQSYIEKFKDNAIRIMHETGVPASIVLAVAMHESGNGNSPIAKHLNNQFGVKGGGGNVYYKNHKKVRTAYKKYDSVMDSFQDFARIMTERKQFNHLTETLTHYDYTGWAKGIQRSGYCSSHTWAAQVMTIIRKYQLNTFDENPEDQTQLAANKE